MDSTIPKIIARMLEYQKINNIENQCVTNSQYLYSCIKHNLPDMLPKTIPVICVLADDNKVVYGFITHVVVVVNNKILDSSYQSSSRNPLYFENLKEVFDLVDLDNIQKKFLTEQFINLFNLTKKINAGELIICDKDFYYSQHEYVSKRYLM